MPLPYDVSLTDAIARLGPGQDVHTFIQAGPVLVGADWSGEDVIAAMRQYGVQNAGEQACRMGHTLVIIRGSEPVFIEAMPESPV